jgi:hypothetical protein
MLGIMFSKLLVANREASTSLPMRGYTDVIDVLVVSVLFVVVVVVVVGKQLHRYSSSNVFRRFILGNSSYIVDSFSPTIG